MRLFVAHFLFIYFLPLKFNKKSNIFFKLKILKIQTKVSVTFKVSVFFSCPLGDCPFWESVFFHLRSKHVTRGKKPSQRSWFKIQFVSGRVFASKKGKLIEILRFFLYANYIMRQFTLQLPFSLKVEELVNKFKFQFNHLFIHFLILFRCLIIFLWFLKGFFSVFNSLLNKAINWKKKLLKN